MPKSFLLRFQEDCLSEDTPGIHCGTKTVTRVYREGYDQQSIALHALSRATTGTNTKIAKEGQDKSQAYTGMHAINRQSMVTATNNMTRSKVESPDDDSRATSVRAIPRSGGARNAATMTATGIKAEATDKDVGRNHLFYAIKPCS